MPMRSLLAALLLSLLAAAAAGAERLAELTKNDVRVVVELERGEGRAATLVGTFTPLKPGHHLYAHDLPPKGPGNPDGLGVATAIVPYAPLERAGAATADQPTKVLQGLPVYPDGPVVLRQPVLLPMTPDGAPVAAAIGVGYMACTEDFCLIPVYADKAGRLAVTVPSVKGSGGTAAPAAAPVDATALAEAVREAVREALAKHEAERSSAIRWRRPQTVEQAEAAIREAHAAGKAALLDFTGPSCNNCQVMAKTVFRVPAVIAAWNSGLPIEIDTDPPHDELAAWQQREFKTQNRPLYVRIAPDGKRESWSRVFSPSDQPSLDAFVAFLRDGAAGSDEGSGTGARFWLLAVLGGLITLLMPCTYPMIPFTLNFFAKQAAAGGRVLPLAACYSLGIVACFVGLGVLIVLVLGGQLATLAGHPVTNLLIALLFAGLGLSLLGAFYLRLPAGLENRIGGGRAGYAGALIMGLVFAVTAFSCTAPFAGSVLAEAVSTGQWTRPIAGMAVYGGTVALPFFLLALAPAALAKLPRAGAWMNEFKVVGGVVEIAAAFKFLAICDHAWGWGVVGRSMTLAVWAACSLALGLYLLGIFRWSGDAKVEAVSTTRLVWALAFLSLGIWFASGLAGHHLGLVEGFFPGDAAP